MLAIHARNVRAAPQACLSETDSMLLFKAYQLDGAQWAEMAKMGTARLAQMIVCNVERPICKRMIGASGPISSCHDIVHALYFLK